MELVAKLGLIKLCIIIVKYTLTRTHAHSHTYSHARNQLFNVINEFLVENKFACNNETQEQWKKRGKGLPRHVAGIFKNFTQHNMFIHAYTRTPLYTHTRREGERERDAPATAGNGAH